MSQVRTGAVPPLADGYVARPELELALIDALFPGATAALVPAGAGGRGCYLDDFLARQSPDARPAPLRGRSPSSTPTPSSRTWRTRCSCSRPCSTAPGCLAPSSPRRPTGTRCRTTPPRA